MAQKKVGWSGHIYDNWLSFKENSSQDIASNDDKIPENIEFLYEENQSPAGRETTVKFVQDSTNKNIFMTVKQKAGHVKTNIQTAETTTYYEQSLKIDPPSATIDASDRSYTFAGFTYTCIEHYDSITSYTWSDTGEKGFDSVSKKREFFSVKASDNSYVFRTEVKSNTNTGPNVLTVYVGQNNYKEEQTYNVKVTYTGAIMPPKGSKIIGDDYSSATITQSANTNKRNLAFEKNAYALTWEYNKFGEANTKICPIQPRFTDGNNYLQGLPYKYKVSSNNSSYFTYQYTEQSNLMIQCYPNSENISETDDRKEEITISVSIDYYGEPYTAQTTLTLTQEKAPKANTDYEFKVEPIQLEWPDNAYGETTAQTLSVTSRTRTYRDGESPDTASWQPVPFTASDLTHFKYDSTKNTQIVYPINANTSVENSIKETLTLTQNNSNNTKQVTLIQEKAPKTHTEYEFEIEPIHLEWPGNAYGETTAQTLSVTSRTKTYREDEDPNTVNWKSVPFTASDLTHFKYDGAKDPQIVYPLKENTNIESSITETLTFTQNGSNNTKQVALTHYPKDLIFFKSDYLVLKYSWGGDTDIDTVTLINTPLKTPDGKVAFDEAPIGFNQVGVASYQQSVGKFLKYGGDTRTSGEEGALIDLKSLAEYISEQTTEVKNQYFRKSDGSYVVELEVYANHFSGDTNQSASVSYTSYVEEKGKHIGNSADTKTHTFTVWNGNETANGSANIRVFAKGQANAYGNFRTCYTKIASIYYDLEKGTVMMSTNSIHDFDDKNGNTLYGYRGNMNIQNYAPTKDAIVEQNSLKYDRYYDVDTKFFPITGDTFYTKIISTKENINGNVEEVPTYISDSSTTNSPIVSYDKNTNILTITLKDATNIKDSQKIFIPVQIYFAQENHNEQRLRLNVYQDCSEKIVRYFQINLDRDLVTYQSVVIKYICINSDGTSLSNQNTTVTSHYSDKTKLPFVLSCTTANAVNTIKGTGDTTVTYTSNSVNSDKKDIFYTMHGIQYDVNGKDVVEETDFKVLQLGTYHFELNTDVTPSVYSYYTSKYIRNLNGDKVTYTFTVISNDDKGNSIDFVVNDTTNYSILSDAYSEKALIEKKNNTFTITIPQNLTTAVQWFRFEVVQNTTENTRYITITNDYKS